MWPQIDPFGIALEEIALQGQATDLAELRVCAETAANRGPVINRSRLRTRARISVEALRVNTVIGLVAELTPIPDRAEPLLFRSGSAAHQSTCRILCRLRVDTDDAVDRIR